MSGKGTGCARQKVEEEKKEAVESAIGAGKESPLTGFAQPKKRKSLKSPAAAVEHYTDTSWFWTLAKIKAHDFVSIKTELGDRREVISCYEDEKVETVFKRLIENNIFTCPVVVKPKAGKAEETIGGYKGTLSLVDIVKHVVAKAKPRKEEPEVPKAEATSRFWELSKKQDLFAQLKVAQVMSRGSKGTVREDFTAFAVVEAFARSHVRLVPVVNAAGDIVNLVTASQIAKFLERYVDVLGEAKSKHVGNCERLFKPVVQVRQDEKVWAAFERMIEHRVSGLAVVDGDDKLKDHLSLRDLKVLSHDLRYFWRLDDQVHTFITKLRKERPEKKGAYRPRTMVYCTRNDTLGEVIGKMVRNRVHRVFVVEGARNKQLLGVVSIRDLLCELIDNIGPTPYHPAVATRLESGFPPELLSDLDTIAHAQEELARSTRRHAKRLRSSLRAAGGRGY